MKMQCMLNGYEPPPHTWSPLSRLLLKGTALVISKVPFPVFREVELFYLLGSELDIGHVRGHLDALAAAAELAEALEVKAFDGVHEELEQVRERPVARLARVVVLIFPIDVPGLPVFITPLAKHIVCWAALSCERGEEVCGILLLCIAQLHVRRQNLHHRDAAEHLEEAFKAQVGQASAPSLRLAVINDAQPRPHKRKRRIARRE